MPKDTTIRARVNSELKEKVDKILSQLGLSSSQAMNLFYSQIALQKGLPFKVRLPNKKTLAAMQDVETKTGKTFENVDDLFEDLED